MWSGRFRQPLDRQFEQWQRSFPFDQKLLLYELAASRAHAQALGAAGVLSAEEWDRILTGLDDIVRRGQTEPNFFHDDDAEDIHHFVEKQLIGLIGETGKKLHAGRSRNEQIATDLRLFVRETIDDLRTILLDFLGTFLARAEKAELAVMPAYTHLQRAEPVLVAHWLMSYFQMFMRDLERLLDCRRRLNECPLGSGAVAGATLALDRTLVSQQLEFDRPTLNSIDATSDRDFAIEFVNALSLLSIHLSRWAEEFILFATQEYGFIQLPEAYSTGSSAMPQKQNPDALELIRGKAARVLGNQVALLAVVKGLPLAYNKDMQETQEPLFEASSTVRYSLEIATGFMRQVEFNCNRMRCACEHGFMNALAAATYLVRHGVPFREAHEIVAHAVQKCVEKKCELQGLSLPELQEFNPLFGEDIYDHLTVEAVLACHDVPGGTAPRRVQQSLKIARQTLTELQETESAYA
ncbi:MAG TPA: argininosuccinate lyase [Candidatus Angelobacter sp.]|jgi:argininosuccinate lyase|nr:argininosuccinate lyase [Candidatus Angelobacter sp.]